MRTFLKNKKKQKNISGCCGQPKRISIVSWVKTLPGIANDEAAEHCSDSSSWAGHTHCGSSSTDELGGSVDVPRDCAGLEGARQDCRLANWQQGLKEKKQLQYSDKSRCCICFKCIQYNSATHLVPQTVKLVPHQIVKPVVLRSRTPKLTRIRPRTLIR